MSYCIIDGYHRLRRKGMDPLQALTLAQQIYRDIQQCPTSQKTSTEAPSAPSSTSTKT